MSTAKMIELPKLPHGEGTMSYDVNGNIVYKKWIVLSDGSKYRKTITGSTIPECFRKMMKEEDTASYLKPVEYNSSKLDQELMYWLNNIKKSTLKVQSWERLESTIRNIIIPSPIGRKKINAITSKDIQSFINSMNTGDYCYSSIKKIYDCLNEFFRYFSLLDGIKNPMLPVVCVMRLNVIKEEKKKLNILMKKTFRSSSIRLLPPGHQVEGLGTATARCWQQIFTWDCGLVNCLL